MIVDSMMDLVMGCTIWLVLILLFSRLASSARTVCEDRPAARSEFERRDRNKKGWPLIGRWPSGFA